MIGTALLVFFIWWSCALPTLVLMIYNDEIYDYIREKVRELRMKNDQRSYEAQG